MNIGELEVIHFRIRNVLDVVNMWDPKAPAMSPQNATNPQTILIETRTASSRVTHMS